MKKCNNPLHPHCTFWVMPGESACSNGHAQSAVPAPAGPANSSYELISALRSSRPTAKPGAAPFAYPDEAPPALQRPHLHISGFDPRAAGGRQAIKVELRGMPPDSAPLVTMQLQSALIAQGNARHSFVRTLRGDWRPLFIEFSSRNKEHGQYRIEVELFNLQDSRIRHKWVCTLVILVPRPDATLTEIHQTFLSTHKNVRVMADDASIARVNAQAGGGRLDIDVHARNASIANLNLDAKAGKVDLGFSTIAWDEDLIEIDVPAHSDPHPHPTACACLVNAAPEAGAQRQVRLFAMAECVLGRFELYDPEADVLLTHFGDDGQDRDGLTRRLSGRHAVIRPGINGFEIEDVSRYGILLDGVWPGKNKPVPLRLGMRIELSASIKGIVELNVTAIMPHGVIVHRIDQGAHAECFYFLEPGRHPGFPLAPFGAAPRASVMPVIYHQNGGFWHLDPASGKETALSPGAALDRLAQFPRHTRFASESYPECWIVRSALRSTHGVADMQTA
ncbi:FHA domain-containing protein [Massilia sp. CCM 9210]|uniref:FHA domain-containing protein n=1 Tax=Massilia scottii TaxID=3057166 RepID=UPI00279687AD|nr:FHA domain-containing protein [Massilia sp. CCM 9210]MDQ1812929.1 FHA domain-containing protein [Massilia sp. CCM 9210]